MKIMKALFISIILLLQTETVFADSTQGSSDRFEWMDSNIDKNTFGCIKVPKFSGINHGTQTLNLDDSGQWKATGIMVEKDKLLQIKWSSKGVVPSADKYKVMYRIDPRFSTPQIFIQKFDRETNQFISDFHQFKGGQLARYQAVPQMTPEQRIKDFTDYFNFNGRSKIPVKKDDVINITLDNTGDFFDNRSKIDRGGEFDLLSIYTKTVTPTNRIFYSSAKQFCKEAFDLEENLAYIASCIIRGEKDTYWDIGLETYLGKFKNKAIDSSIWRNMPICSDSENGMDSDPMCQYDLGRGMNISVGGTNIKNETQKFIHSPFSKKDFFYHKSDIEGDLEFQSPWDIEGIYNGKQLLESWLDLLSLGSVNTMNFLYMGKYLMDIEIGNSIKTVNQDDIDNIRVEYFISGTEIPTIKTSGTSIERNYRGNSEDNGFLWLRVVRPNAEMSGTIQVKTENYSGSTQFSDAIYDDLIKPLREKFNKISKDIYNKLVRDNPALQNIAKTMLVIYIIIYGLTFLAGATQITVTDIVTRVLKIGVIVALFSENSWTFFNDNLFNVFVDGTEYLMGTVVGVSSKAGNIFGFIDPVVEKYTNGTVWGLLFIQLLQLHNGLTFFAMMTIYSILIFFRALLQVIVGYCLAFLGLAIMISLAPFFIILILFERTKSMFDNWISIMFSYMIQPTILLIFFLLIDQIMGEILLRTLVESCWDILIPIEIGLDLNHISIPLSFSFTLPFFPGVPFFVPQMNEITSINDFFFAPATFVMIATSSFLFFALCKLADGLVDYVSLLVQYLTNVIAARQDGQLQGSSSPIKGITGDMARLASPITGAFKGAGRSIKSKVIDQKISRRAGKSDGGNIDYGSIRKPESGNDPQKSEENKGGNKTMGSEKPPVAPEKKDANKGVDKNAGEKPLDDKPKIGDKEKDAKTVKADEKPSDASRVKPRSDSVAKTEIGKASAVVDSKLVDESAKDAVQREDGDSSEKVARKNLDNSSVLENGDAPEKSEGEVKRGKDENPKNKPEELGKENKNPEKPKDKKPTIKRRPSKGLKEKDD